MISSFIFISFVWQHRFSVYAHCPYLFVSLSPLRHTYIYSTSSQWDTETWLSNLCTCVCERVAVNMKILYSECISMYTYLQIECHWKVLKYARTFRMLLLCVVTWKKYHFEYMLRLSLRMSFLLSLSSSLALFLSICWNKKT